MATNGRAPEPTELVYVPDPSWTPFFVAWGIAGICVGLFAGWVWIVAGAVIALVALRGWIGDVRDDLLRLPRRQRLTTAALPPTTLRRPR